MYTIGLMIYSGIEKTFENIEISSLNSIMKSKDDIT